MASEERNLTTEWSTLITEIQSKVEWSCQKEQNVVKMLGKSKCYLNSFRDLVLVFEKEKGLHCCLSKF